MADAVQSYKKHARLLPPFHFFVIPVLLVNLINEMRHLYLDPSRHFAWQVIVAAALLMVGVLSRIQALTVGWAEHGDSLEQRLGRLDVILSPAGRDRWFRNDGIGDVTCMRLCRAGPGDALIFEPA